ncbi:acyltransferase family protein [Terrisporobacter sp.]
MNRFENKKIHIKSIDYMKLLCAFLVVAIHTHPFKDITNIIYYYFSEVLVRIAVPFFFVSSGYFYIKSLIIERNVFKKYIIRLLKIYISWSLIYLVLQLFITINLKKSILNMMRNFIIEFLIYGSYYHLWYIIALIISIIITTIFYQLNKMKLLYVISVFLYAIGVIGGTYNKLSSQIPILSNLYQISLYTQLRRYILMGLPFFVLGYLIFKMKYIPKNLNIHTIIIAFLFVLEIIIVNKFRLQKDIVITFFLYPLVLHIFIICLKYPMKNLSNKIDIGKLSSFIYFVHPLIIFVLDKFVLGETLIYFMTCIVSILLALVFVKVDNNKINKLFF